MPVLIQGLFISPLAIGYKNRGLVILSPQLEMMTPIKFSDLLLGSFIKVQEAVHFTLPERHFYNPDKMLFIHFL